MGAEASLVEQLGRELADGGRQPPGLLEKESAIVRDRRGAAEHVLERRHGGALRGAMPWIGCSSCCGSPSRTRLFAHGAIASTFASDICPASSTNRRRPPRRNPRAPTSRRATSDVRTARAKSASADGASLSVVSAIPGIADVAFLRHLPQAARRPRALRRRPQRPGSSRLRSPCGSRRRRRRAFPARTRSQIMRAPVNVLPDPGGPWIASVPWSSSRAQPPRPP